MPERNPDGTFAKGNSGGPGRNRKRYRIEHILEKIGLEEVTVSGDRITKLEALMRSVYNYALKGNSWAVQFIAERTEGKVPNTIAMDESTQEPITLIRIENARPADDNG